MKILIVGATDLELIHLVSSFKLEQKISTNLTNYSYLTHNIDVLITGIGINCTAFFLGKILAKNNYDLAINIGLAGSFNDEIQIGQTVHVVNDSFSELGAEDDQSFLPLTEMDFLKHETRNINYGKLTNTTSIQNNTLSLFTKVSGITVNTIHGNEKSINNVIKLFNPSIESMEGAAFFFACFSEKLPCIQLRTISNKVEKRNKNNWNIPLATQELTKNILAVIKDLKF